jgi:hypothetical protein
MTRYLLLGPVTGVLSSVTALAGGQFSTTWNFADESGTLVEVPGETEARRRGEEEARGRRRTVEAHLPGQRATSARKTSASKAASPSDLLRASMPTTATRARRRAERSAILPAMSFRQRLVGTLRAIRPVLAVPGVVVAGSEIPNLLERGALASLVVSEDVDIALPVERADEVANIVPTLSAFRPSVEEGSVLVPVDPDLLEVNFIGLDVRLEDPEESYVLEGRLPLLVFGALSMLLPSRTVRVEDIDVPLPSTAGLLVEKLMTERTGRKGDRDLLVALGLLIVATDQDLASFVTRYASLHPSLKRALISNLTVLSLMDPVDGMPDPRPHRATIARLLSRLGGDA